MTSKKGKKAGEISAGPMQMSNGLVYWSGNILCIII